MFRIWHQGYTLTMDIYEGELNENLLSCNLLGKKKLTLWNWRTSWTLCWSMSHIQTRGYFIHCHALTIPHHVFHCHTGLWLHHSPCPTWSWRICCWTNTISKLPTPFLHLLHHTALSFFNEFWWVRSLQKTHKKKKKKRITEHCSSLVHVASGAAIFILLRLPSAVFQLRAATCRPILKPCLSLLQTYRTIAPYF